MRETPLRNRAATKAGAGVFYVACDARMLAAGCS
jgi:hypothetical protein